MVRLLPSENLSERSTPWRRLQLLLAIVLIMSIGQAIAGIFGAASSMGASAMSYKIAKENREWQERMSNTAYQRGMKDMRLAGLNPILAYKQGGAGTPPGSISQVADPGPSAKSAYMAGTEKKLQEANTLNSAANAAAIDQKRRNDKPTQEYEALKSKIKLEVLNTGINSAKSVKIERANAVSGFSKKINDFFQRARENR